MRKLSIAHFLLVSLLALIALANPGSPAAETTSEPSPAAATAADPEVSILRERAKTYWEARVARSERVLDFYPPPAKGGPSAQTRVSEGGPVFFRSFEIEGLDVRGDEATVHLRIEATVAGIARSSEPRRAWLRETWDRIDGVWYKRPVPPGFARRETAGTATTARPGAPRAGAPDEEDRRQP